MRAKSAPINTEGQGEPTERSFVVDGQVLRAPKAAAGLRLAATRTGIPGVTPLLALATLAGVDVIACEDTRIPRRLTERYGISVELTPYHEPMPQPRGRKSWSTWHEAARSH